ncbi:MAG: lipase family protein [Clostridia bacterium]|nr:lipase family protein [Clostridia bacterium]
MIKGKRLLTACIIGACVCLTSVAPAFAETELNSGSEAVIKSNSEDAMLSACLSHSPQEYDGQLALFCAELCKAAEGESNEGIEKKLAASGFENDKTFDEDSYNTKKTADDTAGYSFAQRRIFAQGRACNLVAVVVRGTFGGEWYGNFDIGDGSEARSDIGEILHSGFSKAELELEKNLDAYMKSISCTKQNTIILVTGHSRGAAVANILAYSLARHEKYAPQEVIYAYTFACPNTVFTDAAGSGKPAAGIEKNCGNIFNILNPSDFITYLPVRQWGACRFGRDYVLPPTDEEAYRASLAFEAEIARLASDKGQAYHKSLSGIAGTKITLYKYFYKVAGILAGNENPVAVLPYAAGDTAGLTEFLAANAVESGRVVQTHGIGGYIKALAGKTEKTFLENAASFVPEERGGFADDNYA